MPLSEVQPVDTYPLLPLQKGMLYHLFADPRSGIDVNQIVSLVEEPLELDSFRQAWRRVSDRHPALRATYHWAPGEEPMQKVWADVEPIIEYRDWRKLDPAAQEANWQRFLTEDRARPLQLTEAPSWRVTVLHYGEQDYRFSFTGLHGMIDGHSMFNLLDEFFTFYDARREGREIDLPVPPPFRVFVEHLSARDRAAEERYWRAYFKDFEEPPILSVPRPEAAEAGRGTEEVQLSPERVAEIRRFARAQRVTPAIVFRAAWAVLVSRLSGARDVVFGDVHWGRRATVENAASMVGLFINTLPLRILLHEEDSTEDLLRQIRDKQAATRDFEHTALQDIQRWSGLGAGSQLFETLFIFDQAEFGYTLRQKGGHWAQRRFLNFERTSLPVTLNIHFEPECLLYLSYDRDYLTTAWARRLLQCMERLIEQMLLHPERPLADLDLVPEDEAQRLVHEWNRTERDIPQDATLPRLFEARVGADPGRAALVAGEQRMTYAELDGAANRIARFLRGAGVKRGDRVGICLERTQDLPAALLGTQKAGAAYVPLDPDFPPDRLSWMVEDAAPAIILTEQRHAARFDATPARTVCLDGPERAAIDAEAGDAPTGDGAGPEDLAYVIYTSGSTGRPKGVMLTHRNVVNCFLGMDDLLGGEPGTWLAVTSISFDISVIELFYTLCRGYTVVLSHDPSKGFATMARDIAERGVTHLQCTPSLAKLLLADAGTAAALRTLRCFLLGGEPLPPELLGQLGEVPGRAILNMYGPTETAIWSTAARVDGLRGDVHIGRPIANTRLYVTDAHQRLVPVGAIGELLIGGAGVARGYLNRPDLTAERFLSDPWAPGEDARMYRTGDLVRYREDGVLECLGRLDHQVKIRGHRIELGEIEAALLHLDGVRDAAVLVRTDGGAEPRIVAYVIPAGDAGPGFESLRGDLARRLPAYMLPQDLVVLPTFPRTPNGKLDRKALPPPAGDHAAQRSPTLAPRSPVEKDLAAIWTRVLGHDHIGIRDNFFEIGGDSAAIVQVYLGVRDRFGLELPLALFFEHPTVEELAGLIAAPPAEQKDAWLSMEWFRRERPGPPLVAVHGVENIFGRLPPLVCSDRGFLILTTQSGFDGRKPPYHPCRTVEQMAEKYLAELRKAQPEGPYYLLGFCLGGLITFEMARTLRAAGEEVAFLGLINSLPASLPCTPAGQSLVPAREGLLMTSEQPHLLRRAVRRSRRLCRSAFYRLNDLHAAIRNATIRRIYITLSRCGVHLRPEWVLREIGQFGWEMVKRYQPQPYGGKIWIFAGSHAPADFRRRWEVLAEGGLEAHRFPADHYGLMQEPHVLDLAARINACMARVEVSNEPAPDA